MEENVFSENPESGGAGVKLLLVLVVVILIANAGYNYVPVAYQGESFRQDMEGAIVKGTVLPITGKAPVEVVKQKLLIAAKSNDIPDDAVLEVKQNGKTITGHVSYSKSVPLLPFDLYVYKYDFEHTSAPTGFISKTF